ncbi:EMILIN-2-like [Mercenaria mercenaria]|uniref:EMILIN-2-like n=1 Tax=Mercenaria mercenaria TaxID=6596 RepID=UPI00234F26FB|nr:EMILIN-2-like [Mercenaria mercenaria]
MINGDEFSYRGHWSSDKNDYQEDDGHTGVRLNPKPAKPPAFMVQLSNTSVSPSGGGTITFDNVKTNVGKYYKPNPGIFVVPFNGTYSFTLNIASFDNVALAIMANNVVHGWTGRQRS